MITALLIQIDERTVVGTTMSNTIAVTETTHNLVIQI